VWVRLPLGAGASNVSPKGCDTASHTVEEDAQIFSQHGGFMSVLLMLLLFAVAILVDYCVKANEKLNASQGTQYTTPGYEALGALAQDGGKRIDKK